MALALLALAAPAAASPDDDIGGALERTVRRAVAQGAASVVRLEVERSVAPPTPEPAPAAAPDDPKPPEGPRGAPTPDPRAGPPFPDPSTPPGYFRRPVGATSAVVIDADGGLVTSLYNVSDRVTAITAVLADGRRLPARLMGADPNSDVAYLRVDARGLVPIPLATDEPRVGQLVLAVGCPLPGAPEPAPTATLGIVAATHRLRSTAPVGETQGTAVQVSARLNYGNNGGPIVDLDGRCVALAGHCTHDPTDPDARKGFNSGVGFATPVARLAALLPRLRAGETLPLRARPFLGVRLGADPRGEGVRIEVVEAGTPAARARLRAGDVIVIAGSTQVESDLDLRVALDERDPGDALELVVLRGPARARVELTVTLGARPPEARRR